MKTTHFAIATLLSLPVFGQVQPVAPAVPTPRTQPAEPVGPGTPNNPPIMIQPGPVGQTYQQPDFFGPTVPDYLRPAPQVAVPQTPAPLISTFPAGTLPSTVTGSTNVAQPGTAPYGNIIAPGTGHAPYGNTITPGTGLAPYANSIAPGTGTAPYANTIGRFSGPGIAPYANTIGPAAGAAAPGNASGERNFSVNFPPGTTLLTNSVPGTTPNTALGQPRIVNPALMPRAAGAPGAVQSGTGSAQNPPTVPGQPVAPSPAGPHVATPGK